MGKKNKKQNCDRLIEKDYLQQMVDSKLKEVEKEEIRIYIDTNIGLLAYRFCPHEFFKLVARYQDKYFSDKLRRKIKRKYKKSKFDIIGYKYPDLYEEYFYKSLYFMNYFKGKVGSSYFNTNAEKLFDDYKFGYDLNAQNRSDVSKIISQFVFGVLTMWISLFLKEKKIIGDYAILFPPFLLIIIIFCLCVTFDDNAYDSRLFRKLLQDEFDNKNN
ncbi:hypothetical protein [Finegoldia magna]|uniref:hypothetical protein n=1 Tax=Finegoldia magna TaxID=1260 RepID=UPI000B917D8B|nr:hypothetical protein [Finegoldia magna]MDU1010842.1 hypothetical protein [Finegoldia magna]MDU1086636.1 hypothetical protein [Finegoldia magna]OXZ39647.1 hypothetical protein B9N50_01650 [Finegoldia magna]